MHERGEIELLRPSRNEVDPDRPYHFLQEYEQDAAGDVREVNTIFLTGKECAFRCIMCDLWKNTLTFPTPPGALVRQVEYALERLPPAKVIKLYNSSNFFDPQSVPLTDYGAIASLLKNYDRVIVENHPALCNAACVTFSGLLEGRLEVAMGLESIHPEVLPRLNKRLTKETFRKAARFLKGHGIDMRAFILLNPPFLTGIEDNITWTLATVGFAFDCGAGCCSVIPTRPGNGIMERLQREGKYTPPSLETLEKVHELALSLGRGRVFADTWDTRFMSTCPECFQTRINRLERMNLTQETAPAIHCTNCSADAGS